VLETTIPAAKPLEGLGLENWTGQAKNGLQMDNIKSVELRDIRVKVAEGPVLKIENVTGTGLDELAATAKP
jgi:hypothetical protein